MSLRLAVGCIPERFTPLVPEQGEYARAAPTLAALARAGELGPETRVELYAYELVERAREHALAGTRLVACTLWPEALFTALEIQAHPWRELAALLPPLAISFQPGAQGELALECHRLGLPEVEPAAYAEALAHGARAQGWARRFARPAGFAGEPERRTAAGFLLRAGRILLERRPPGARVTPGVWDIPGGHRERGEDERATLAREFEEELGLRVHVARPVLELDAREPPAGRRYRHAIFVLASGADAPRAREGQELGWFTPDEALALPDLNAPTGFALQELLETDALRAQG